MKKSYLFLSLAILFIVSALCLSVELHSQPSVRFYKTNHDFGIVANQNVPPAVFEFKNTGDEPLAVLMVKAEKTVTTKFEHKFIFPGEKGRIYIRHNNNKMGRFKEKIEVLTNASHEPFKISIEGKNVAVQDCFPDKQDFNKRNVYVIDAINKQPIPKASVEFVHNHRQVLSAKTNRGGKVVIELKTGMCFTRAKAKGYHAKYDTFFVNTSMPNIYIEMFPVSFYRNNDFEEIEKMKKIADSILIIAMKELSGKDSVLLPEDEYKANNVVLLLDISLSMRKNDKLELLKISAGNLVQHLREIDRVSIIAYSSNAYTLLSGAEGSEKDTLIETIRRIQPFGVTNGVKGLEKGYEMAAKHFVNEGNNQLILATDGKFTGAGQTDETIAELIRENAKKGIIISIMGFGLNDEAIDRMKKMAGYGNGDFILVGEDDEVRQVLVDEVKDKSRIK